MKFLIVASLASAIAALPREGTLGTFGSQSGAPAEAPHAATAPGAATAQTTFGTLDGLLVPATMVDPATFVEFYGGVPFAEPPTGANRFADTVDWSAPYAGGRHNATAFGNQCLQMNAFVQPPTAIGDEDCLYLNIWRPAGAKAGDKLPVLFFIHGGAFVIGSGSMTGYWGANLAAAHNAVVVTTNYRLGALGFMAFEGDTAASTLANFGLRDQTSALRWAKAQLPSLGGDPSRVMIYGESAGGISVTNHLVSPPSAGLFSRVMSESGFPTAWSTPFALQRSTEFAGKLGCSGSGSGAGAAAARIACLRKVAQSDVLAAQAAETGNPFTTAGWAPSVDGAGGQLPGDPRALLAAGKIVSGVDGFGAGSNTNEGTMFVIPYYPGGLKPGAAYDQFVHDSLNGHGAPPVNDTMLAAVKAMYPCGSDADDCSQVAADLIADSTFVCGTREALRAVGKAGKGVSTHMYHFNHRSTNDHGAAPLYPDSYHVYHTIELPFVFNNELSFDGVTALWKFTDADKALAKQMGTFWATHAATGSPGGNWPTYDAQSDTNLLVDTDASIKTETGRRQKQCDFWASVRPAQH